MDHCTLTINRMQHCSLSINSMDHCTLTINSMDHCSLTINRMQHCSLSINSMDHWSLTINRMHHCSLSINSMDYWSLTINRVYFLSFPITILTPPLPYWKEICLCIMLLPLGCICVAHSYILIAHSLLQSMWKIKCNGVGHASDYPVQKLPSTSSFPTASQTCGTTTSPVQGKDCSTTGCWFNHTNDPSNIIHINMCRWFE